MDFCVFWVGFLLRGKALGHMPGEISKVARFFLRQKCINNKATGRMRSAVSGKGLEVSCMYTTLEIQLP